MTDREHPPFEVLVGAVEARRRGVVIDGSAGGGAPANGMSLEGWANHLSSCTMCQERMREIDEVMASMRDGDAGDAPETWIERARRRTVPPSYFEPLHGERLADVMFDSAHQRFAGTRSSALDSRQLLFAWNHLEVELSIGAGIDSPWNVSGQVFAHEGAPVELGELVVVLSEGEREIERVRSRSSGEFMFGLRPKGPFRLDIRGDGWTLRTPAIEP